jgi:hypothetical protein
MKTSIPLGEAWESRRLGGCWEHAQSFEIAADLVLNGASVDLRDLPAGATVLVNGVELGAAGGSRYDRFQARHAIRPGRNEIAIRVDRELPADELCRRVRVVAYDKVSVSGLKIDPEIVDRIANVWITIQVANHTDRNQPVLASIVVAQGENREKVEIAEIIAPSGGEIDAVIRIVDPAMWERSESGGQPAFDCLIGLQIEGEVMDVAAARFRVG